MLEIQKNAMVKLYAKRLAEAAKDADQNEKYGLSIYGGAKWINASWYISDARVINRTAKKLHGEAACDLFNPAEELEAVGLANKLLRDDSLFIFAPGPNSFYVGRYSI